MRLFVAIEMNRSVEESARDVIDDLRDARVTSGASRSDHLGGARASSRDRPFHRRG